MTTYVKLATAPEYVAPVFGTNGEITNKGTMERPIWSGKEAPPAPGTPIRVTMNGLGLGTVQGYFVEYGYLGLLVRLVDPPKWWRLQNANDLSRLAHVFGIEFAAHGRVDGVRP